MSDRFSAMAIRSQYAMFYAQEPHLDAGGRDTNPSEESVFGSHQKNPNRSPRLRPLVLLLLLIIVAGGTYLASDPSFILDLLGQGPPSAPPPQTAPPAPEPPAGDRAGRPVAPPQPQNPGIQTSALPSVPTPSFGEGQRVTVKSDLSAAPSAVSLTTDVEGMHPGASVPPGSTLTVQDAELHNNVWVYSVRTDDGATGWIAETKLRLMPK